MLTDSEAQALAGTVGVAVNGIVPVEVGVALGEAVGVKVQVSVTVEVTV
jgi:hypothetical protein